MNSTLIIGIVVIVLLGAAFIILNPLNTSTTTTPAIDNGTSSDAAAVGQISDQNYLSIEDIPPSP